METVAKPAEAISRPLPSALAATLVFVASGAVLVLEVLGLRLVGPYIGVTLQTSSSVIGVALAAIAYGAWLGGWLADRTPPRRLLAPALLIGGVATLITLPVVRYAGEGLRGSASGGVLLLTALAVFVPATALSAIPPLVVKLQLGDLRETGRVVGRLSSVGTLGGITATLGTGFLLVATLPSSVIIISLGALLIASGLALAGYFWRLDRSLPQSVPKSRVLAAVVAIVGAGLAVTAPNPCDVETAYHCARVAVDDARPTGRLLLLNGAPHSYVDLANPRHLEFAYTRWIAAAVDTLPAGPIQALHLGGGGFTLPTYVTATRPGSANTVLEIDGGLVDLDRQRLGVREGPELSIWVGDARIGLAARPDKSADLVVGDAFGHLVVPWHLATRELVADVRRVLRPGGIYALNMIDYPSLRFARAEVATVAAVFPHIALAAPPEALANREGANFVIFASESALPLDALGNRLATDTEPVSVISGPELTRFTEGADALTDDYAPVDQLLAR